jgi:hypothetical protein
MSAPVSGPAPSGDILEAEDERYDYGDVLVIPPLGDRAVEADVQALLGSHGIRARTHTYTPARRARTRLLASQQYHTPEEEGEHEENDRDPNTGSTHADYEYVPVPSPRYRSLGTVGAGRREEDAMEVDEMEEERDCVPSHTPSRSSSPSPSTHIPAHGHGSPAVEMVGSPARSVGSRERSRSAVPPEVGYDDDDLDLAGTCFDPSGGFVYIGSTAGVVEYCVRGAEKRWWLESEWL